MAGNSGPNIVANDCVFTIDGANYKSYNSGSAPNDVLNIIKTSQTGSLKNGTGYTNGAWEFDGTDDEIDFGDILGFENDESFTFDCWVRFNSLGTRNYIVNKQLVNSPFTGIVLERYSNNNILFGLVGSVSSNQVQVRTPVSSISTSTWYHIVATYDGTLNASGLKIYINNTLPTLSTITNSLSTSILNNANFKIGGPSRLNGDVASIKIYNRALTAQEVLNNYNATKHRFGIK